MLQIKRITYEWLKVKNNLPIEQPDKTKEKKYTYVRVAIYRDFKIDKKDVLKLTSELKKKTNCDFVYIDTVSCEKLPEKKMKYKGEEIIGYQFSKSKEKQTYFCWIGNKSVLIKI